jgi:hypothetical protein
MKYRYPIFVIFILFTAFLAYILRNYLSQNLFIPLINLIYFFWKILESIPQIFWWVLLIIGLVFFISKVNRFGVERKPKIANDITRTPGIVSGWNRMIDQAKMGNYSRWRLLKRMADLIIAILAYQHRLTEDQIQDLIIRQDLQLPEQINAYLLQGVHSPSFQHFLENEQNYTKKNNVQRIDMEIELILNYLETDIN